MDSGLTMVQTTNNIFNQSLYDFVVPQSLFAWQRVRLANSMAHTAAEWAQLVAPHNSGTCKKYTTKKNKKWKYLF